MAEYRNHDPLAVMKTEYYGRHVAAMTAEDLYGKGEIAEELAFRDYDRARLELMFEAMCAESDRLRDVVTDLCDTIARNLICDLGPTRLADIQAALDRARNATPNLNVDGKIPLNSVNRA